MHRCFYLVVGLVIFLSSIVNVNMKLYRGDGGDVSTLLIMKEFSEGFCTDLKWRRIGKSPNEMIMLNVKSTLFSKLNAECTF